MRKNNKSKPKTNQGSSLSKNIIGITLSTVISILILVILTAVISLILLKSEKIADNYIMYFYFCSIISAFIGGFTASKRCTFKGIISGLVTSVVYNFLLTVIILFVCRGHIRADIGILYAVTTVFFILGGIVAANTKRRK